MHCFRYFEYGIRKKAQEIQKFNDSPHLLSRGGYELMEKKLMEEKMKTRQRQAECTENTPMVVDPPSPIARHVKWKMARTNKYGKMTSAAAQQISNKIDELEEQSTQGTFVPHGRNDILNTALGREEHPGRVLAAGHGVTISSYFGQRSSASNSSAAMINPDQLVQIIGNLKQEWTKESALVQPANPNVLLARVSTKESCAEVVANVVAGDPSAVEENTMGLYVVCGDSKQLVALGKVYHVGGMIHNVPYADEVLPSRVSVVTVYDGDARVPIPTPEIEYVREAMNTFIGWPTNLVKPFSADSNQDVRNPKGHIDRSNAGVAKDPLGEIMKILYEVYMNPVELPWEASRFGIPNIDAKFYITHADMAEIISGHKCLKISILQLWMMYLDECATSRGDGSVYGFLEPQSIHIGKEDCQQCQLYIETWVKESQRCLYLGAYLHQSHWQLFVLCPRENMVVWFCS
ncbi:uncharacterized protein LOC114405056 [Glycine soja]|nr:uncharacterized protein LOC114405056 [Glycine soja]|eukprot:XP_014629676.1 uncharacterized protein LOC102664715 [Glycine max]